MHRGELRGLLHATLSSLMQLYFLTKFKQSKPTLEEEENLKNSTTVRKKDIRKKINDQQLGKKHYEQMASQLSFI